jgi:Fe-S oxidoreductase
VRESALGATVFVPGEPEGWEGWEDAGVPPARLGDYLRQLTALMAEYGYRSALYGHYGQGCVHLRINFDFNTVEGLRRFREFIDRAADLVLSFGGSLSGEHGDGQARAALLPKMFGPDLMRAFREFKAIWDPDNCMNPGKLVDAVRVYDPVENLRHHLRRDQPLFGHLRWGQSPSAGPRHHLRWGQLPSAHPRQREGAGLGIVARPREKEATLETHFVFAADGGSFERATERCVGVGACRKTEGGVMCPSYRATGEEQYSTRGRARLLWEMLAGALREEGFKSKAVQQALDLCLSCKACKSECPVQVDMAAYKSEYLAQRYKHGLHPLHHYIFGFADKLARLGSLTPALTNALLTGPITSPLIKRIVGVAHERQLPKLAAKSYQKAKSAQTPGVQSAKALRSPSLRLLSGARVGDLESQPASAPRPEGQLAPPQVPALQVVLWPDTWNNCYHPQTLSAAESLLTEAGFTVTIPKGHICCGRPLYDFGLLSAARSYLALVLERMAPQIEGGLPFIFLEPSCASVFKDELLELFPNDASAQRMSRQVWLLADFIAAKAPNFAAGRLDGAQILLHGHCHHKADFGGSANEIALLRKAGATVEAIQAGCCGMAGPFGFEADKFEVSKAIANDGLLPAVDSASPATLIVADGFSCREQISQLGHREARHFAEVLARDPGCGK